MFSDCFRGRDDDDVEEQALTLIKLFKLTEDDKGQITTELFDRAGKHLDRRYKKNDLEKKTE